MTDPLDYPALRQPYVPRPVRALLLAEAPPDDEDRFFFKLDVSTADHLFVGVMNALYPRLKNQWIGAGRPPVMKHQLLEAFKRDGFSLLDLFDRPRKYRDPLPKALERLHADLRAHIAPDTPIICVKVTVHEQVFERLRGWGYTRVWHKPIAFPASGQQGRFRAGFLEALAALRPDLSPPLEA